MTRFHGVSCWANIVLVNLQKRAMLEHLCRESFLDKSYSWKEILSKNGLLQAEDEREARDFVVQFFLPYFTEGLASNK